MSSVCSTCWGSPGVVVKGVASPDSTFGKSPQSASGETVVEATGEKLLAVKCKGQHERARLPVS